MHPIFTTFIVTANRRPRPLLPDVAGRAGRGDRGDAPRLPLRDVPRWPLHDPLHPNDTAQVGGHLAHASHPQLRPLPHTQLSLATPVKDIRYELSLTLQISPIQDVHYRHHQL